MADVSHIWFHGSGRKDHSMQVSVTLRPSGQVNLDVQLPQKFYDVIMDIAQKEADAHEAKMRAEILGDEYAAA